MNFDQLSDILAVEDGVEVATMMKSPCLRYKGDFMGMMFDKEDCMIVKVSPERVKELIDQEIGFEFNYTGKAFKEWVMIPLELSEDYLGYLQEALTYARLKKR
ncbi:MAG: hypothetical protein ABJN40_14370 [Sneathiella sp.]